MAPGWPLAADDGRLGSAPSYRFCVGRPWFAFSVWDLPLACVKRPVGLLAIELRRPLWLLDPTRGGLEGVFGSAVECDRGTGGMVTHGVDHLLEQHDLVVAGAYPSADDDALPRVSAQSLVEHRRDVIVAVEANQAGSDAHTVLSELRDASLDGIGDRGGIPGAWDSIGIKSDHQNAGWWIRDVHVGSLDEGRFGSGLI